MRWTHLPAAGSKIWILGGGRRRVRPWPGACDARLDAGSGAFAAADRGYSMACPQGRVLAERVSACSCGLLHRALSELKTDLPVAEFLKTHFTDRKYAELRDAVKRMVEGYDAADPDRASTFALRDEWMGH